MTEKEIVKIVETCIGLFVRELKSLKQNDRMIEYKGQVCRLIDITDGAGTLNTGGLAFCLEFPDGHVENVQDCFCKFIPQNDENNINHHK